jgi:N6-L-threonylcarbamoyladenine synthase
LVAKTVRAVEMTGARRLVAAGGVTANAQLRARLAAELKALGCSVVFPPPQWCTDNGAMIAHAAAQRVRLGFPVKRDYRVTIHPRWPLPL